MAEKVIFTGQSGDTLEPTAVPATCTITTIAGASLVDGEGFLLWDCIRRKHMLFEFNIPIANTTISARADAQINLAGSETADQVRDAIIAVINGTIGYPAGATPVPFGFTAANTGAATVTVTQRKPGPDGNGNSAETVANAGFVITNMAGGTKSGIPLEDLRAMKAHIITVGSGATASGVVAARFRIWGFREIDYINGANVGTARGWTIPGSGTDANRGFLNAGAVIGEDGTDAVRYAETVENLAGFSDFYLQQLGTTGTTPAFWGTIVGDPSWQYRN